MNLLDVITISEDYSNIDRLPPIVKYLRETLKKYLDSDSVNDNKKNKIFRILTNKSKHPTELDFMEALLVIAIDIAKQIKEVDRLNKLTTYLSIIVIKKETQREELLELPESNITRASKIEVLTPFLNRGIIRALMNSKLVTIRSVDDLLNIRNGDKLKYL